MVPAGNDGIEIDIVARGSQEFPKAAATITAVAQEIDRLSFIDRPFMGFYERQPQKICREQSVGGPLEMADMLRYDGVAKQIVRIDTPRPEAKARPKDRTQIGVAAPRIGGEPDGIVRPHEGALSGRHGTIPVNLKDRGAD
jgi:hypothetical protein